MTPAAPKISFFAPGIPAPGGSKRAFFRPGMKHAVIVDACKRNKDWRAVVALAAREAYRGQPLASPLRICATFFMPRPKGHYGAKGLKASAPRHHTKKPDATKLLRSTEDALTGILWADDAQIAVQIVEKRYADGPCGVSLSVFEIEAINGATP
jgi:Holliday junction resolvase RusA-like endonuclease